VEGEIESLIVNPHRARQAGRHRAYSLPVAGYERDPFLNQTDQMLIVKTALTSLEDVNGADVPRRVRGVQRQHRHLERRQSLWHRHSSGHWGASSVRRAGGHDASYRTTGRRPAEPVESGPVRSS